MKHWCVLALTLPLLAGCTSTLKKRVEELEQRVTTLAKKNNDLTESLGQASQKQAALEIRTAQDTNDLRDGIKNLDLSTGRLERQQTVIADDIHGVRSKLEGDMASLEKTEAEMNRLIGSLEAVLTSLRGALEKSLNTIDQQLANLGD